MAAAERPVPGHGYVTGAGVPAALLRDFGAVVGTAHVLTGDAGAGHVAMFRDRPFRGGRAGRPGGIVMRAISRVLPGRGGRDPLTPPPNRA